mmetsp:Transcript_40556/g.127845  ORF Transcript_40556/g.127845 Transcript_40556/m.127845 type:complete len:88 (-) Transcript_40556:104-367(-)
MQIFFIKTQQVCQFFYPRPFSILFFSSILSFRIFHVPRAIFPCDQLKKQRDQTKEKEMTSSWYLDMRVLVCRPTQVVIHLVRVCRRS